MKKKFILPIGQALVIACVLIMVSVGAVTIAQWRYELVDRAEAKIKNILLPQETPAASLPPATPFSLTQRLPTAGSLPEAPQPPLSTVESLPAVPDVHNAVLNILAVQSRLPDDNDLLIDESEDRAYLQSILDIIFPDGMSDLSEEEITIEIQRYVVSTLDLKPNTGNATKILQDGYAICGGMSVSFRALVRLAGIPARKVDMYGLISQGAHSLVDVFYDDHWHLFDPTYGLFFYSEAEYNQAGRIASLNELVNHAAEDWHLFKIVDQPWKGYDISLRSSKVVRAADDYLADYHGYPFTRAYRQMFATTFPVAYDDNQIISFPVVVDLTQDTRFAVGEVDNSNGDTIAATSASETAGKAVIYYLIGTSSRQYLHTWFIQVPSPGLVRVTYYSTELEPPTLMLFPLKAAQVISASQAGNKAEFLLRISDPQASVQFWSANGVYWVDAMYAEWLGSDISVP